jgi:hypothetical protein
VETERCPSDTVDSGYRIARRFRSQRALGHEGLRSYRRNGSQGGTLKQWWGANPNPTAT